MSILGLLTNVFQYMVLKKLPKARDGSYNKNRMKRIKHRPHSLQPTKGTLQNWITMGKATSLDWGLS